MKRSRYEQDPDGDVDLVLKNPEALRREWPCGYLDKHDQPEPLSGADDYDTERPAKRFRVSSRHLSLASPVFHQILHGPWKEAASQIPNDNQRREVEASDWDSDAMVIVMDIIHGHLNQVPRSVSLELLTKIAIIVDYYKCHEVVCLFSPIWINALRNSVPAATNESWERTFIWLFVCWVFGESELFSRTADVCIKVSRSPIESIVFPLPEDMLIKLDKARDTALEIILSGVEKLRNDLMEGRTSCPYGQQFECSSMLLGSLMKGLRSQGVFPPAKVNGHVEKCSLLGFQAGLSRLKKPVWFTMVGVGGPMSSGPVPHRCNLRPQLDAIVRKALEGLPKFRLEDFPSSALSLPNEAGKQGSQEREVSPD